MIQSVPAALSPAKEKDGERDGGKDLCYGSALILCHRQGEMGGSVGAGGF